MAWMWLHGAALLKMAAQLQAATLRPPCQQRQVGTGPKAVFCLHPYPGELPTGLPVPHLSLPYSACCSTLCPTSRCPHQVPVGALQGQPYLQISGLGVSTVRPAHILALAHLSTNWHKCSLQRGCDSWRPTQGICAGRKIGLNHTDNIVIMKHQSQGCILPSIYTAISVSSFLSIYTILLLLEMLPMLNHNVKNAAIG